MSWAAIRGEPLPKPESFAVLAAPPAEWPWDSVLKKHAPRTHAAPAARKPAGRARPTAIRQSGKRRGTSAKRQRSPAGSDLEEESDDGAAAHTPAKLPSQRRTRRGTRSAEAAPAELAQAEHAQGAKLDPGNAARRHLIITDDDDDDDESGAVAPVTAVREQPLNRGPETTIAEEKTGPNPIHSASKSHAPDSTQHIKARLSTGFCIHMCWDISSDALSSPPVLLLAGADCGTYGRAELV